MKTLSDLKFRALSLRHVIRATFLRMPSMMQQKRHRECLR